jgi:hypothetical protein
MIGVASIGGVIAGAAAVGIRDRAARPAPAPAEACTRVSSDGLSFFNEALVPWRGLSFRSVSVIGGLRGPLNGLTIVRAEVDGPGFEDAGDVSLWAVHRAVPPGWTFAGPILFAINSTARHVDGRSMYPGNRLRQFTEDGEAVYDPRVIRAIAPAIAASCVDDAPEG